MTNIFVEISYDYKGKEKMKMAYVDVIF